VVFYFDLAAPFMHQFMLGSGGAVMHSIRNVALIAFVVLPIVASQARAAGALPVRGQTTPAQVEDGYGLPSAISVDASGCLTLIYPLTRFAIGAFEATPSLTLASSVPRPAARHVRLHFNADLIFDGYSVTGADASVGVGLAAR
jgi:hypothetical protein